MKRLTTLLTTAMLGSVMMVAQNQVAPQVGTPVTQQAAGNSLRYGNNAAWHRLLKTDYELVDMKGNKYNIKQILASGKHIMFDIFEPPCAPCWQLFKSGLLEEMQQKYKDQLVIIMFNPLGSSESEMRNSPNGDWTSGGRYPLPVVSSKDVEPAIGLYHSHFPHIQMVDLDGYYRDVSYEIRELKMNGIESLLNKELKTTSSKPEIKYFFNSMFTNVGVPLTFDANARSVDPNVKYTWTFEGGSPATSNEKIPSVTWNTPGSYKISLTLTDKNGTVSTSDVVTVNETPVIRNFPYTESFEGNLDGWTVIDNDNNGSTWRQLAQFMRRANEAWTPDQIAKVCHSGKNCMVAFLPEPYYINDEGRFLTPNGNVSSNDYLITPKIAIPNDGVPTLQFYARNWQDLMRRTSTAVGVAVSTTGKAPEDFKDVLLKPEAAFEARNWAAKQIDLSKYKGKEIYIAFIQRNYSRLTALIDDVSIDHKGRVGNQVVLTDSESMILNYNNDNVYVKCPKLSKVQIFDIQGQVVMSALASGDEVVLTTSSIPSGVYVVRGYTSDNKVQNRKIIIK